MYSNFLALFFLLLHHHHHGYTNLIRGKKSWRTSWVLHVFLQILDQRLHSFRRIRQLKGLLLVTHWSATHSIKDLWLLGIRYTLSSHDNRQKTRRITLACLSITLQWKTEENYSFSALLGKHSSTNRLSSEHDVVCVSIYHPQRPFTCVNYSTLLS